MNKKLIILFIFFISVILLIFLVLQNNIIKPVSKSSNQINKNDASIRYISYPNNNGEINIINNGNNIITVPTGFNNSSMFRSSISPNSSYGIASNFVDIDGVLTYEPFLFDFVNHNFIKIDKTFTERIDNLREENDTITVEYIWSPDSRYLYAKPTGLYYYGNVLYKITPNTGDVWQSTEIFLPNAQGYEIEGFNLKNQELKIRVIEKYENSPESGAIKDLNYYNIVVDNEGVVRNQ